MDIVLKKPIISEKSIKMAKNGWFTFWVDKRARKRAIAKAVADQFGVDVIGVKTATFKGELKMQKRIRGYFRIPDGKKASVSLKKGQKIGLFEAVEEETKESSGEPVKEKKSLLKGTKVRIEKESAADKSQTLEKKEV